MELWAVLRWFPEYLQDSSALFPFDLFEKEGEEEKEEKEEGREGRKEKEAGGKAGCGSGLEKFLLATAPLLWRL